MNLASQVDMRNRSMALPKYRYARIPLNNAPSGQVVWQPSGNTLLEWKLSASTVHNLSRSFVAYQYTLPAVALNYGLVAQNAFDFQYAYFGDGSGLGIAELQSAGNWVNTIRPVRTKLQDMLTMDQLHEMFPCNQLNSSNIIPFSRDGLLAGTDNAASVSYLEQQYLSISPNVNTAMQVNRYVPLNAIKDTIFDQDLDLVYGQDMYIRLTTQYLTKMCGYTTTPANPNAAASFTNVSASITASNVYLYLAIEVDEDLCSSLLSDLSRGSMKLSIPYTYAYRFNSAAQSSSANISMTLTKNYGRAVKRIVFVSYAGNEYSFPYAWDHSNVNGTKISSFASSMNGRPLTDQQVICYNPNSSIIPTGTGFTSSEVNYAMDYREARKFLAGSCLLNYSVFQTNWLYADQWGVPCSDTKESMIPIARINSGYDLLHSGDSVWAAQVQTPALQTATNAYYSSGLVNYVFVTFLRTLQILPNGIALSP